MDVEGDFDEIDERELGRVCQRIIAPSRFTLLDAPFQGKLERIGQCDQDNAECVGCPQYPLPLLLIGPRCGEESH